MPNIKLGKRGMSKTGLLAFALIALAALAYLGWSVSNDSMTASAHSVSELDYHYPVMMAWPWGIPIVVSMNTIASTTEHRSGQVMITDGHSHSIHIPEARCGHNYYPTCFAYGNPKIRYYHSGNSYVLQGSSHWDLQDCIAPEDDLVGCWVSDTSLGWTTIPINAAPTMVVIIGAEGYRWPPGPHVVKTIQTTEYEVD